jgi:hypothetical protein
MFFVYMVSLRRWLCPARVTSKTNVKIWDKKISFLRISTDIGRDIHATVK